MRREREVFPRYDWVYAGFVSLVVVAVVAVVAVGVVVVLARHVAGKSTP